VTELPPLGLEIPLVVAAWRDLERYAFDNLQAVPFQPNNLARIVGEQPELLDAEITQNLRSKPIGPEVGRKAQPLVRLDRVQSLILELIGTQLVMQPDPAAFLADVEDHAPALGRDQIHGKLELVAAIAPLRAEDITGQALGMHANENQPAGRDITHGQREVGTGIERICIRRDPELAVPRGQPCRRATAHQGFRLAAVGDQIGDRDNPDAMPGGKPLQVRHAGHRPVLGHDLALTMGDVSTGGPVLARVHSECLTGDVFGSGRCDCGEQLQLAMELIAAEGRGVILYVRQEGRGIGLHNKLRAYQLQDQGLDTVEANERLGFPADLRTYGLGAQILRDLGVQRLRLLTNNPRKVVGLEGHGLEIVARLPLEVAPGRDNQRYLEVKQQKLGHLLGFTAGSGDALTN